MPFSLRKYLIKFRTLNHKLPVETGWWSNVPRVERKCHFRSSDIGEEYHYLVVCKNLGSICKKYLTAYYCKRPNSYKFEKKKKKMMNSTNVNVLRKLCLFIKDIFELLWVSLPIDDQNKIFCGLTRALISFCYVYVCTSVCHCVIWPSYALYWMYLHVPHISMYFMDWLNKILFCSVQWVKVVCG